MSNASHTGTSVGKNIVSYRDTELWAIYIQNVVRERIDEQSHDNDMQG